MMFKNFEKKMLQTFFFISDKMKMVGWLVVLGLTALSDRTMISVYIEPSPREKERERERERERGRERERKDK